MSYLTWIDDTSLLNAVGHVHKKLKAALEDTSLAKLQSNVIDPFSVLFEINLTSQTINLWLANEAYRQWQKSLSNAIGEFHQLVLGNCPGWQDLGIGDESGLDVKKIDDTIFAEIKNKYNTMNASSEATVFSSMVNTSATNPNSTIYLVDIVRKSKKPYNKMWNKDDNENQRIRRISGDAFYELVTGKTRAIEELYRVLPQVIYDFLRNEREEITALDEIKAIEELERVSQHILDEKRELLHFFSIAYGNLPDTKTK